MLFDLRGRRRRAVQVTYLMLALLMGGGLVLFGIGGDVSGGLFDAFGDRDGGGDSGNSQLEKRIERVEKRLQAAPGDADTLALLVRLNYQAGSAQLESGSTEVPDDARDDFAAADRFYQRYLGAVDGPIDATLAQYAFQMYSEILNKPAQAKDAFKRIAERENSTEAYLTLVQLAAQTGDTRTADLAGQKAIDLAPEDLRKQVKKQVEQLKKAAPPEQGAGG
jgi:hypothetical protein